MKFDKKTLQELVYGKKYALEGFEVVEETIDDVGRWQIHHSQVFKYDKKFYKTYYSVGSDEGPYEYHPDKIECHEVFLTYETVPVYISKKE